MRPVLRFQYVEDELCIYFEDESWHYCDRTEVRRHQGGLWQRGGYDSYMTDDEWESLEGSDSRRLEDDYQRLIKSGEVEDIDAMPDRPRWIPVSERLPEMGVDVLAHSASVGRQVAHTVAIQGGIAWHWGTSGVLGIDADYWMPLPEPPPETRADLREQWDRLHKGPRPETDVVITDDVRAWHEAAREIAKTKGPEQTLGDLLFNGKAGPPEAHP